MPKEEQAGMDEEARREALMVAEAGQRTTWTFTFAPDLIDPLTGQSLGYGYVVVPVDVLANGRPDVMSARVRMLARFGDLNVGGARSVGNWSFDYPTPEAAGVGRYPQMVELDFDTGLPR